MFDVDPLLLRLFVKKLQVGDLPALFAKVPTSVILMRLAEECASKIEVILCIHDYNIHASCI